MLSLNPSLNESDNLFFKKRQKYKIFAKFGKRMSFTTIYKTTAEVIIKNQTP
jgi:hypothetical protein